MNERIEIIAWIALPIGFAFILFGWIGLKVAKRFRDWQEILRIADDLSSLETQRRALNRNNEHREPQE
jgi:hypothetical protein